jgi:GH15 family glucan-1,4-alpha-glucosidase
MTRRIEDYALIGDCETAALVGKDGSIDWLCWPRFDSDACFAALLGNRENGHWQIVPDEPVREVRRQYVKDTMILETVFETEHGVVSVTDFMPPRDHTSDIVRLVDGREGEVPMRMEFIVRFGYGQLIPWVTRADDGALVAVAGPDKVILRTPVALHAQGFTTVSRFIVRAGEEMPFVLAYAPSHLPSPPPLDPRMALARTERFWRSWARKAEVRGPHADLVMRSLITLKALTYAPTGGLVAAPTTSLPEEFGGPRNWDYRYCWIRDATLTLLALMNARFYDEAAAWTNWLHRAVAGSPQDMQIMYGLRGERRLFEWEAHWLSGFCDSRPVRIGNAAHSQFQIDVYGELMDAFHQARRGGLVGEATWAVQRAIIDHVTRVWCEPDEGIWEVRSGRQHFTFSKVMAWVAIDRAVKSVETFGLDGPVDEWRALRTTIHQDVCRHGFNPKTGGFQRAYDEPLADASLLLLAELGFLKPEDPRFAATVKAVEDELLTQDGLVCRYNTNQTDDGLPPGEGAFLPCSFWLADAYVMLGRVDEAKALFDRLASYCNDVGLLSEEYDVRGGCLAGNFPQAFTHVALIATALNLSDASKPVEQRGEQAAMAAH